MLFVVAVIVTTGSLGAAGRAPGAVPLPDVVAYLSAVSVIAVAIFATSLADGTPLLVIAAATLAVECCIASYSIRPALFTPNAHFWYLSPVTAPALLWLAGCLLLVFARQRTIRGTAELLLVAFILAIALNARWQALEGIWGTPLSPDAEMVASVERSMTGPFDTWVREPAWLWGLWVAKHVWPADQAAGYAFSLTGSMGLLVVSYAFARKYAGRLLPAILLLALLTRHLDLILSSVAAHRTELYALALVLVAYFAFSERIGPWCRTLGLAGSISLTLLTQSAGAIPAVAAAAYAFLRRQLALSQLAVVLLVSVASITPYAIANHHRFGQAFYFARTLVPTFYRNYEFMIVRGTGCDGCPTPAQMAVSSYSGRPATMREYLFALHSPREVFSRTLQGYVQVFLTPQPSVQRILGGPGRVFCVVYLLYLAGAVAALLSRTRDLLLIPLLSLNLLAFVVPLGIDPRLLLHLAPFALLLACLAPYTIYGLFSHRQRERDEPIRVLRIISRLNVGGPARHAVLLNGGLQAHSFETLLVHGTVGPGEASFDHLPIRQQIPVLRIPTLGRRLHLFDDIRAFAKIWKTIRDFQPDIVHTHTAKAGALGRLAAALHNALSPPDRHILVVHTFHGHVLAGYFNAAGNRLARLAEHALSCITDRTIAISDLQRTDLVDRFQVVDGTRTTVIPLGLQLEHLLAVTAAGRGSARAASGYGDAFVVGFVGRLVPIKQLPLLIDALAIARRELPDIRLVITGDGPERASLESYARDAKLDDIITFAGWREDLVSVYAPLDAVALTSRNEGTPVALIEAMAAGVPVVATAVGGVPDVVTDGETGLLTTQSADEIANALLAIARDHAGAAERAANARETVRAKYSDTALVERVAALYEELLPRNCPASAAVRARLREPA